MIITKVDTFPLRIPFKPDTRAAASAWGDKGLLVADSLLVRIATDEGLEGWGETFGFGAVPSARLAIHELIAPLCIGRDATQIGPLMLEVQKKLQILGRTGPLFYGISAIDIALWDIAGKAAGGDPCDGRARTADAMIEWRYFDLEAQLYDSVLTPVSGQISVPQRPRLGLDPDRNVICDYLRVGTDTHAQKVAL